MKGKLICYELVDVTPSERTMLHRKLYGYKDHSNSGKYTYERPGLIQDIEGKKIIDAVLFVRSKEAMEKITDLLHEYDTKIYAFDVQSEIEF